MIFAFKICFKNNVLKCCYIVFRKPGRNETNLKIMLHDSELNRVATCEYLAVIFSSDITCDLEIDMATNAFIKHFNGLICKFNSLERDMIAYVFRTYTSYFCAVESWLYNIYKKKFL